MPVPGVILCACLTIQLRPVKPRKCGAFKPNKHVFSQLSRLIQDPSKWKKPLARAWTSSGKTLTRVTSPSLGCAMPVLARLATRSARRADARLASRQSPNQALCPCIRNPRDRLKSRQWASMQSTFTGTTGTAAVFIPGNSCDGNARVQNARRKSWIGQSEFRRCMHFALSAPIRPLNRERLPSPVRCSRQPIALLRALTIESCTYFRRQTLMDNRHL